MIRIAAHFPPNRGPLSLRGWLVVAAAALVGGVALAVTLFLTTMVVVAVTLWATVSMLWRASRGLFARSARADQSGAVQLEGRRTPDGWVVEAV